MRLTVGVRFRLDDGSEWTVGRITPCSASVKCVSGIRVGTRHIEFQGGRTLDVPVFRGGHRH